MSHKRMKERDDLEAGENARTYEKAAHARKHGNRKREWYQEMESMWPTYSWPLRTALSCWLSSLVYLTPLDERGNGPIEGRLLAPITGAPLSLPTPCLALHLGQTSKQECTQQRSEIPHSLLPQHRFAAWPCSGRHYEEGCLL